MDTEKLILVVIMIILGGLLLFATVINLLSRGDNTCNAPEECVVYGHNGSCNCGCYNKAGLPTLNVGRCFCIVPQGCDCVKGICQPIS